MQLSWFLMSVASSQMEEDTLLQASGLAQPKMEEDTLLRASGLAQPKMEEDILLQASGLAQPNMEEVPTYSDSGDNGDRARKHVVGAGWSPQEIPSVMASPGGSKDDEGEESDEAQSEIDLLEIAVAADEHVSDFTAINMTAQKDEFLAEHNKYRCMHGVGNLVWNNAMASRAASWGGHCCQRGLKHSNSYQNNPSSGENLAAGSGTIAGAVKGWYDEVNNCKRFPGCEQSRGGQIGHFSAMVWSSAAQLGCAVNPNGWKGRPLYVCHYASSTGTKAGAPNMGGQYQNNVFAKSKQESQCSGSSTGSSTPPRRRRASRTASKPLPLRCKDLDGFTQYCFDHYLRCYQRTDTNVRATVRDGRTFVYSFKTEMCKFQCDTSCPGRR